MLNPKIRAFNLGNTLKCFIASAFGREDVDTVYDRCVEPTLKKFSIKALRVDRVEHNDNIDNKIMDLLEEADFAIADLTYARPSVYFEAGYALGKDKPVICISRDDHFQAKDNDPHGLLRIHFDLKMKNIISWSNADDDFSRRLEKRLKYVLDPLIKKQKEDNKLKLERTNFQSKSVNTKLNIIKTKAESMLKVRSFSMCKSKPTTGLLSSALIANREHNHKSKQIVALISTISAVKSYFEAIDILCSTGMLIDKKQEIPVCLHYIVASLESVPKSRVTKTLSSFELLEAGTLYKQDNLLPGPKINVYVHVISGIKSQLEFTDAFRSILAHYNLDINTNSIRT